MRYALQQPGAGIMERVKSTVLLGLSRSCRTGAGYQSRARIRRPKDIQYIARMGYIPFGRIIRGGHIRSTRCGNLRCSRRRLKRPLYSWFAHSSPISVAEFLICVLQPPVLLLYLANPRNKQRDHDTYNYYRTTVPPSAAHGSLGVA
jgi:hypothetical protein